MPRVATAFIDVSRVLVIKLRHIGDVLLTLPVFRALRETFPDCHLAALVNAGTDEVLTGNPLIDEILTFDRSVKSLGPFERYRREGFFIGDIRRHRFDMTIDLTGGDRPALLSFLSGARYRLGWIPRKGFMGKRRLYTHLEQPDGKSHMVLQNLAVVRALGIDSPDLRVDFHIPDKDRRFVSELLTARGFGRQDPIVHVHPTSRWLFKCWRDEYMAEVMTWLLERNTRLIVTSSSETHEMKKTHDILSLIPRRMRDNCASLVDLSGRTTIKQLAAISEASTLFFGVDSAPMHIAAAVGTPVVALFGPSGAHSWGPWDAETPHQYGGRSEVRHVGKHAIIQQDWHCVPCGRDGCEGSKVSRCLADLTPESVISVITGKLLSKK